jgi:hypothetical protein
MSEMSEQLSTTHTAADTALRMLRVFGGMFLALLLAFLACPSHPEGRAGAGRWLASARARPGVRETELWWLRYGGVWICAFALVIAFDLHARWHERGLLLFMLALALPLLLRPFLAPWLCRSEKGGGGGSGGGGKEETEEEETEEEETEEERAGVVPVPSTARSSRQRPRRKKIKIMPRRKEVKVPLFRRFEVRATLWVAIFSGIGNWWYTHYFYSVLGAHYTMTSWDWNGVPAPMYFATHFYFCFYHVLGNCVLRRIATSLPATPQRHCFSALAVLCAAYATAFMETFTIAAYPCYRFDDFHHTATVGSAFYGLYFVVSFPMFFRLSGGSWGNMEEVPEDKPAGPPRTRAGKKKKLAQAAAAAAAEEEEGGTLFQAAMDACATGMVVLCLLDFVRVYLGQDLVVKLLRPCKTDMSLTCMPRTGVGFC